MMEKTCETCRYRERPGRLYACCATCFRSGRTDAWEVDAKQAALALLRRSQHDGCTPDWEVARDEFLEECDG
jgi:hypothetical protein